MAKIQFFIGINSEINTPPSVEENITYENRTKMQLKTQLSLLTSIIQHSSCSDKSTLAVVVLGEDFFQGAEISTASECRNQSAQVFNRDIAFNFIANELRALSKKFPTTLIIPGSMYVGVNNTRDASRYNQNGDKRSGGLYVQNIIPVAFNGEIIRLVKKGDFLKNKKTKKSLLTSDEHLESTNKGEPLEVPSYREDSLEDDNGQLIFLGKTPLPGEENLRSELDLEREDLFNPVFEIDGVRIGIEICGDHSKMGLQGEDLDIHIVSSNGIGNIYNACGNNGYRVQADAESLNLTGITANNSTIELKSTAINADRIFYSAPLPHLRHSITSPEPVITVQTLIQLILQRELTNAQSSLYTADEEDLAISKKRKIPLATSRHTLFKPTLMDSAPTPIHTAETSINKNIR